MARTTAQTPLIVGTAGHIDHGKSNLVKAMTGIDPDRLKEEKKRGITIELGFAQLELPEGTSVGLVDVPGHEKFVRQMIAGATGVDIALLCIAADDGVMPQTKEHLAVLELLDVCNGVIALTKCDLVDEEWIELACEELRAFLADSPFASAPIVPVSAKTGKGIDELKSCLADVAKHVDERKSQGFARLPVDRVFTIKGSGTVVTGTLWDGSVHVGDELEVLPSGTLAKVRGIQVHGKPVESSRAGTRTALNLAGLSTSDIRPGNFLATPGALKQSAVFDARFTYLGEGPYSKPFASGSRVHVAHGTKETTGRVLLMNKKESLAPGSSSFAQIRLDESLPLAHADRFVVRSFSPVHVIGGGIALNTFPRHRTNLKEADEALIAALEEDDERTMLHAAVRSFKSPAPLSSIERITGMSAPRITALLESKDSGKEGLTRFAFESRDYVTETLRIKRMAMKLEQAAMTLHATNPTKPGFSKEELYATAASQDDSILPAVALDQCLASGTLTEYKGSISHPKASLGARNAQAQLQDSIVEELEKRGIEALNIDDVLAAMKAPNDEARKTLVELDHSGRIVSITREWRVASSSMDSAKNTIAAFIEANGPATATQLKDALGTSRKYAIPFLEFLDSTGFTVRNEDVRTLGCSSRKP